MWYAVIDLENFFFSVPVHKDNQKQFIFNLQTSNIPFQFYLQDILTLQLFLID